MNHSSPFAFSLNDKVTLLEINRPGRIDAMTVDYLGIQYRVSYWAEGDRRSAWVQADEIILIPQQ